MLFGIYQSKQVNNCQVYHRLNFWTHLEFFLDTYIKNENLFHCVQGAKYISHPTNLKNGHAQTYGCDVEFHGTRLPEPGAGPAPGTAPGTASL